MMESFPLKPTYKLSIDQLYCLESIVSLPDFIKSKSQQTSQNNGNNSFTIQLATKLLYSIYSQMQLLFENNIAISFIDFHDIMVIDNSHFFFCNCDKLYPIKKNNHIVITDFYDVRNPFLPPEFLTNIFMPFTTYYTTAYYSLAIVILSCLHGDESGKSVSNPPNPSKHSNHSIILQNYQHTKLYQTLLTCLVCEPTERNPILF
tara:strand:+ start:489 stop:1100 length:612 start_codon:yes stop_codon:yes gene_type:complete